MVICVYGGFVYMFIIYVCVLISMCGDRCLWDGLCVCVYYICV